MFDIFQLDQTDRVPQEYRDPCSACLDFSCSWTCTDPHDQKQHGWPRVAEVELASLRERVGAQGDLVRSFFMRSEEHTSELQSLMRISYAVFFLIKTNRHHNISQ